MNDSSLKSLSVPSTPKSNHSRRSLLFFSQRKTDRRRLLILFLTPTKPLDPLARRKRRSSIIHKDGQLHFASDYRGPITLHYLKFITHELQKEDVIPTPIKRHRVTDSTTSSIFKDSLQNPDFDDIPKSKQTNIEGDGNDIDTNEWNTNNDNDLDDDLDNVNDLDDDENDLNNVTAPNDVANPFYAGDLQGDANTDVDKNRPPSINTELQNVHLTDQLESMSRSDIASIKPDPTSHGPLEQNDVQAQSLIQQDNDIQSKSSILRSQTKTPTQPAITPSSKPLSYLQKILQSRNLLKKSPKAKTPPVASENAPTSSNLTESPKLPIQSEPLNISSEIQVTNIESDWGKSSVSNIGSKSLEVTEEVFNSRSSSENIITDDSSKSVERGDNRSTSPLNTNVNDNSNKIPELSNQSEHISGSSQIESEASPEPFDNFSPSRQDSPQNFDDFSPARQESPQTFDNSPPISQNATPIVEDPSRNHEASALSVFEIDQEIPELSSATDENNQLLTTTPFNEASTSPRPSALDYLHTPDHSNLESNASVSSLRQLQSPFANNTSAPLQNPDNLNSISPGFDVVAQDGLSPSGVIDEHYTLDDENLQIFSEGSDSDHQPEEDETVHRSEPVLKGSTSSLSRITSSKSSARSTSKNVTLSMPTFKNLVNYVNVANVESLQPSNKKRKRSRPTAEIYNALWEKSDEFLSTLVSDLDAYAKHRTGGENYQINVQDVILYLNKLKFTDESNQRVNQAIDISKLATKFLPLELLVSLDENLQKMKLPTSLNDDSDEND